MADNDPASSLDGTDTLHPYVLWTTVAFGAVYLVIALLTVFSDYFIVPEADVYDTCAPYDVTYFYYVKVRAKSLPTTFVEGKNSIIIMLDGATNECICRWNLNVKKHSKAGLSILKLVKTTYRLNFTIGRRSPLPAVKAVRVDHNMYGHTIKLDSIRVIDAVKGIELINLKMRQPIRMLPHISFEDDKMQVFPIDEDAKPVSKPDAIRTRTRIYPIEFVIIAGFGASLVLLISLYVPFHDSLSLGRGIANGIVGAIISMFFTLPLLLLYKLTKEYATHFAVNAVILIGLFLSTAGILYLSVTQSKNLPSGQRNKSSQIWWLIGFIVGASLFLVSFVIFALMLSRLVLFLFPDLRRSDSPIPPDTEKEGSNPAAASSKIEAPVPAPNEPDESQNQNAAAN